MMSDTHAHCPICSGSTILMTDTCQGYKQDLLFKIYSCENCFVSFPDPQDDANKLYDVIYQNGERVPGYDRYWKYYNVIKKKTKPLEFLANSEEAYWGVKSALEAIKTQVENPKILEIGSGLGYLTYALREANYDVVGLDISSEAVNKANERFGNYFVQADLFEYVLEKPGMYDVVILTEVIEHIQNPLDFIEAIFKLLRTNGKIVLTTPNKSIAPSDVIWDTEAPPIHHWWFTENCIQSISKNLGAKAKFVDFTGYYKRKPKLYKPGKARKRPNRSPIIGQDYQLIRVSKQKQSSIVKSVYKRIVAILGLKSLVYLITAKLNKDVVFCSDRGMILCAILQKL